MMLKVYTILFLLFVAVSKIASDEVNPSNALETIEEIVPTRINHDGNDSEPNLRHHRDRSLLECSPNVYQYSAAISDDLRMLYVVTNSSISIELRYDGEAWIGLGISPDGRGKMVGSEAWIAVPLQNPAPFIYNLNSKLKTGVVFGKNQTLLNGTATQVGGVTVMRLQKLLNDGPVNVPVNGNGENVFIWAFGSSNTLGKHRRRGAFRLALSPCTKEVTGDPEPVDTTVVCGLLSLSIFCPISFCGVFGRLLGFCS